MIYYAGIPIFPVYFQRGRTASVRSETLLDRRKSLQVRRSSVGVSVHALTWLLCRQSQLWVQVRAVVSIYSAFVLLSSSTDPVQTDTCGQNNNRTTGTSRQRAPHSGWVQAGSECKQEVSTNRKWVQTSTPWCASSTVLPLLCPTKVYIIYDRFYISSVHSYCFQPCSHGWTSVYFRGAMRVQILILLFFWLFPCSWPSLCSGFFLFLSC